MDSSPPTAALRKTVDGKTVDVPVPAEYVVDTHVRMHQAQVGSDPATTQSSHALPIRTRTSPADGTKEPARTSGRFWPTRVCLLM